MSSWAFPALAVPVTADLALVDATEVTEAKVSVTMSVSVGNPVLSGTTGVEMIPPGSGPAGYLRAEGSEL